MHFTQNRGVSAKTFLHSGLVTVGFRVLGQGSSVVVKVKWFSASAPWCSCGRDSHTATSAHTLLTYSARVCFYWPVKVWGCETGPVWVLAGAFNRSAALYFLLRLFPKINYYDDTRDEQQEHDGTQCDTDGGEFQNTEAVSCVWDHERKLNKWHVPHMPRHRANSPRSAVFLP